MGVGVGPEGLQPLAWTPEGDDADGAEPIRLRSTRDVEPGIFCAALRLSVSVRSRSDHCLRLSALGCCDRRSRLASSRASRSVSFAAISRIRCQGAQVMCGAWSSIFGRVYIR